MSDEIIICKNFTEIVCIWYGVGILVGSVLIAFLREGKAALKFAGAALASLLIGLGQSSIWDSLIAALGGSAISEANRGVLAVLCGLVSLLALLVGIGLLYLPTHIAKQRGKKNFIWIIGLSAFSLFIPFLWSIALFLAYKNDKGASS